MTSQSFFRIFFVSNLRFSFGGTSFSLDFPHSWVYIRIKICLYLAFISLPLYNLGCVALGTRTSFIHILQLLYFSYTLISCVYIDAGLTKGMTKTAQLRRKKRINRIYDSSICAPGIHQDTISPYLACILSLTLLVCNTITS